MPGFLRLAARPTAASARVTRMLQPHATWRQPVLRRMLSVKSTASRAASSLAAASALADAAPEMPMDMNMHMNMKMPMPMPMEGSLELSEWTKHAYSLRPRATLEKTFLPLLDLPVEEDIAELTSRAYISDQDVDKWLAKFEIPEEEMAKCTTPEEVKELRRLYARQLRLECSVYEMAMEKRVLSMEKVNQLGRTSDTNAAKSLIVEWMEPATKSIKEEQKKIRANRYLMDINVYGPAFLMLDAQVLAAITLNNMINLCMMEAKGATFLKLVLQLGRAVQEEVVSQKDRHGDSYMLKLMGKVDSEQLLQRVQQLHDQAGLWDKRTQLKIGSALVDCVQQACFLPESITRKADGDTRRHAFVHDYVFERNRRRGVITIDKRLLDTVLSTRPSANVLPWTARYLPMLVPPKKWTGITNGGYLRLFTKIMRHRDSSWQMDCVRRGEIDDVLKPLNLMSEVPWVINKDVLNVMLQVWEEGGGFGGLPSRSDLPLPEWREEYGQDEAKKLRYDKAVAKVHQQNNELHSLRCDAMYKLQVAQEFKDEKEMYFPYNMDFRGRVYPIPPNLNHLGADLSRSLLIFRDRKPLGAHGLRWLKIHLANVFGIDKCSFDDRASFTDAHIDQVMASARNPLGTGDCAWWRDADYPFLALGVCFELRRALESPNPEEYESNLPVHQDGSCNGLQHYAALARDRVGGQQVNLVPGSRPSDVYSGVAAQVIKRIDADAAMELPEEIPPLEAFTDEDSPQERKRKQAIVDQWKKKRRKEHAQLLQGTICRKVVKQTVMTSVYGVTYVGARKQIMGRLEEVFQERGAVMDAQMEHRIYQASCYAAEITMESMGNLFTSARSVMAWLADCAAKVAESGQAMSWVTPLGLPVAQPYRRKGRQQVRTKLQHVILVHMDQLPVNNYRQKTAFPPNFVHSLDSTHMLMTARKCLEEDKIAFAAVHDSYWTHACDVDLMNQRLREQFVNLYQQPLLETFREHLCMRFPKTQFKELPPLGDLDLRVVLDSPYFFN